jgi:hypothetical protein
VTRWPSCCSASAADTPTIPAPTMAIDLSDKLAASFS